MEKNVKITKKIRGGGECVIDKPKTGKSRDISLHTYTIY